MASSRPNPRIGFLLNDVSRLMRRDFQARAANTRTTQADWRTLAYLSDMEGCTQRELADRLDIGAMALGRRIDRLARRGLIERRGDPRDRRTRRLHLTARARPVVDQIFAQGRLTYRHATRGFSAAQLRTLEALLLRLRANLTETGR
jgi:DNA-binding MarR family transcriptional regulator